MKQPHNDTLKLEFRSPIIIGQGEGAVTYTHVELREPIAGDMEKAARADTNIGTVITLVSEVGKVPRLVAEKMCRRDMNRASEFFAGFDDGPETAADGQN